MRERERERARTGHKVKGAPPYCSLTQTFSHITIPAVSSIGTASERQGTQTRRGKESSLLRPEGHPQQKALTNKHTARKDAQGESDRSRPCGSFWEGMKAYYISTLDVLDSRTRERSARQPGSYRVSTERELTLALPVFASIDHIIHQPDIYSLGFDGNRVERTGEEARTRMTTRSENWSSRRTVKVRPPPPSASAPSLALDQD